MNSFLRVLLVVCSTVIISSCGAKKDDQPLQKKPQSRAEFVEQARFTTLQGDTVQVSDFKGKVVIIDFWETWCKPCINSFPGINKLQNEYPNDLAVLTVTPGFTDTPADAQKFAESHNYNFTYLFDSDNLHEKLDITSIPVKVYVDAKGNFIKQSIPGSSGPEGDYKKAKKIVEEYRATSDSVAGGQKEGTLEH